MSNRTTQEYMTRLQRRTIQLDLVTFLPCDAAHTVVMPQHVVCLPVQRLSVTFRYRDHIGRNTSKIISRLISLRLLFGLSPTWAIWPNGARPKFGWNRGGSKAQNLQYLRNGVRMDQGYYDGLIGTRILILLLLLPLLFVPDM